MPYYCADLGYTVYVDLDVQVPDSWEAHGDHSIMEVDMTTREALDVVDLISFGEFLACD